MLFVLHVREGKQIIPSGCRGMCAQRFCGTKLEYYGAEHVFRDGRAGDKQVEEKWSTELHLRTFARLM